MLVLVPGMMRVPESKVATADHTRAALIGASAAVGLVFYLWAAHQQMLAIAVAIASLYPVIPVLLGVTVHDERLERTQTLGLIAAGIAVVLLSVG